MPPSFSPLLPPIFRQPNLRRLHFHFSLSCIGEGNGTPPQCSCLENPRDRGSLVGCRLWGRTESDTTEAPQQQQQSTLSRGGVGCDLHFTSSTLGAHWGSRRSVRPGPGLWLQFRVKLALQGGKSKCRWVRQRQNPCVS